MKRIFDFFLSVIIFILLIIIIIFIVVAVRLSSKGPVLYWSDRVGENNKIFKMPKFRSMSIDTPTAATHLLDNPDSYLSPIGSFLRLSSLDELPQLFNVLVGEMSMVGARPHPIALDDKFSKLIQNYMSRYKEKPGITGLAQINNCRGETDTLEKMENRIKYDIEYSDNVSIYLYFKILFLTPIVIIFNKNVY